MVCVAQERNSSELRLTRRNSVFVRKYTKIYLAWPDIASDFATVSDADPPGDLSNDETREPNRGDRVLTIRG